MYRPEDVYRPRTSTSVNIPFSSRCMLVSNSCKSYNCIMNFEINFPKNKKKIQVLPYFYRSLFCLKFSNWVFYSIHFWTLFQVNHRWNMIILKLWHYLFCSLMHNGLVDFLARTILFHGVGTQLWETMVTDTTSQEDGMTVREYNLCSHIYQRKSLQWWQRRHRITCFEMLNLFKHFKKDIKSKSDFGDFRFPSYTMYALYLRFICLQDIKNN